MTIVVLTSLALATVVFVALRAWRRSDETSDREAWSNLASLQPSSPAEFDPAMVAALPEPAQRFFRFAIEPGAPLYTVAEIVMAGDFSLGTKAEPKYMPMRAEQILAAPHGFVWKVRAGRTIWFSGSDGAERDRSWSRFWLQGILPVARAGDNIDHARAAFGRYVAEAVFWTPAALLPGEHVRWEAVGDATARVTVTHLGLAQAVDVSVAANGQPGQLVFQRWSNANPDKVFRLQPFGAYLSGYRRFSGFRLPTRVEAGNFFGTADYFAFFKATVTGIRFSGY